MKRIQHIALALTLLITAQVQAQTQTRYLVKFKNKGNNPFTVSNPAGYLSARSIGRRTRYAIPVDSTDLPVTPRYLDSLRAIPTVVILNPSRWLNQVTIRLTDTSAANLTAVFNKINSFPFVQSSTPIGKRDGTPTGKHTIETVSADQVQGREQNLLGDVFSYGSSANQIRMHNGNFLHNIGLRGEGMVIGMLDAGYLNYLTVKAFDSARANNQILGTWDFVNSETSVNEDDAHGMQCFSIIAANIPGQFVGTAPKASFYLFRSEDAATEYLIEEHNWVCAAERVDSSGGDLISSSLGYTTFDAPLTNQSHTYTDMNGNTTIAAIGADLAAKKGILVVNAAGNDGGNAWGKIGTPADGDSVLAVGAVNSSGVPASFTSRGPSSDGQTKPDVASQGVATTLQLPSNIVGTGNGTSYACPNMAGLATCLWQGFPEYNNMKIIDALRKSGSRFTNPNDTVGFGIPDMKKAVLLLLKDWSNASTATMGSCRVNLAWNSKDMKDMKYEIERKAPGQSGFTKVGEIAGSGTVWGNRTLTYSDSLINVNAGTITYRIRQVIDTALASFSADYIDTATVNLASSCITTSLPPVNTMDEMVTLSPNPNRGQARIAVTTPTPSNEIFVRIVNNKGQVISSQKMSKASGTATFDLPVSKLAAGKYYVSVYQGTRLLSTKEMIRL